MLTETTLPRNFVDAKLLALEPDEIFVQKSEGLISELPVQLRTEAQALLGEVSSRVEIMPGELIYIPIAHFAKDQENDGIEKDKRLRSEMWKSLAGLPKEPTLISSGEVDAQVLKKSAIQKNKMRNIARHADLGLISKGFVPDWKIIEGYEEALCDFTFRTPNARGIGVDKFGFIGALGAAIDSSPAFASAFRNPREIVYRLAIEARTRQALNMTVQLAKPGERVIFVQGIAHSVGVMEWCKRNNVNMKFILLPTMRNP